MSRNLRDGRLLLTLSDLGGVAGAGARLEGGRAGEVARDHAIGAKLMVLALVAGAAASLVNIVKPDRGSLA